MSHLDQRDREKKNSLKYAHDRLNHLSTIKMVLEEKNLDNDIITPCSIDNANEIKAHNGNCQNCEKLQKEIEDLKQELNKTRNMLSI